MNMIKVVLRFFAVLLVVLIRLLLPFLLMVLRVLRALVFTSLSATVNGPARYTDRLAAEWTRRLLELGGSRDHIDQIYSFCRLTVGSMIVFGWIVSILFTVEFFRIVFGLFI